MDIIQSKNYAIQRAVTLVGSATINKLNEFYTKTSTLENDYKQYALQLIEATLKVNHSSETKKDLTNLLLGLGFKKANVSKMLGAQEFINTLESRGSNATQWVKSLPVSNAYALGTCDEMTFARAWEKSNFGTEKVSMETINTLKDKHIKPKTVKPVNEELARLNQAKKLLMAYPELTKQIDQIIDQL